MNQKEKKLMVDKFQTEMSLFIIGGMKSEMQKERISGMTSMLNLFFTKEDVNRMINECLVTSEHKRGIFINIESWLKQIEKETGEKMLLEWSQKGLNKCYRTFDYLYGDEKYTGFFKALEMAFNTYEEESA